MAGYRPEDAVGAEMVETANGIIETDLYELKHFDCLALLEKISSYKHMIS